MPTSHRDEHNLLIRAEQGEVFAEREENNGLDTMNSKRWRRVMLHLACFLRDWKWVWHWAGIRRELVR